MKDSASRRLPKTDSLFVRGAGFPTVPMKALEGHDSSGRVDLKPVMVGDDMLMVEILEEAGVRVPSHSHDDHESIVYLIRGRMELVIGNQTFVAQAGDVWRHPIGVAHSSVALEDCVAIEVKSPPRKTWNLGETDQD
jgi:quercetin dioxygenase-like cupin family protein